MIIDRLRARVRKIMAAYERPVGAIVERLPAPVRRVLGAVLGRRPWHLSRPAASPWNLAAELAASEGDRFCLVCGWSGEEFDQPGHVEFVNCPICFSSARDRFLLWCLFDRAAPAPDLRLLETSPRLDRRYRATMAAWFDYLPSDFDGSAHKGSVRLDLQDIDLPDATLDVVLSAHVLEHVPEPDAAMAELWRVLAPGGRLLLQVPVQQPATTVPETPEYHDDDTLVHWRFGLDLTARLEAAGFDVTTLVTEDWKTAVDDPDIEIDASDREFDVAGLRAASSSIGLTTAIDSAAAARIGLQPAHQFLVWECRRPNDR